MLLVPTTTGAASVGRTGRINADAATLFVTLKCYDTINQREQRIIPPAADVLAGMQFRAALPNQNVPGANDLPAVLFDAAPLRVTVPPVARTANTLFVSHFYLLL